MVWLNNSSLISQLLASVAKECPKLGLGAIKDVRNITQRGPKGSIVLGHDESYKLELRIPTPIDMEI
jgi:hypothetical protein